jgi:zinc protease
LAVDDPSVPFDDYYTTPQFSWLRAEVPSRGWRETISLLAEMIRLPKLTQDSLDDARKAMTRIVARRDGSPRDTAGAKLDALLAPGHPLTRPVYGTTGSLAAITLDDLVKFQPRFATGRRAIVTVAGPVAIDEVVAALESDLGPLPQGDPLPPVPPVAAPASPGSAEVVLGKTQAAIALGAVLDLAAADRPALAVAVAILSDRLAFDLRETRGLAYSIDASLRPWGDAWRWDITMGTRPDNVDAAVAGLQDGVRAFRDAEPTAEEVSRTVNAVRGRALMRRMTRISLAYEAGMEAMRGGEAPGDERRAIDALDGVGPDDVRRMVERFLGSEPLARVVVR